MAQCARTGMTWGEQARVCAGLCRSGIVSLELVEEFWSYRTCVCIPYSVPYSPHRSYSPMIDPLRGGRTCLFHTVFPASLDYLRYSFPHTASEHGIYLTTSAVIRTSHDRKHSNDVVRLPFCLCHFVGLPCGACSRSKC